MEAILQKILAELQKTPYIYKINTAVNKQNAEFTIYQSMACRSDIYVVFRRPETTNDFYALQNIGAAIWVGYSNDYSERKFFLLPVTNYLIQNREEALTTLIKICPQSDLGGIPIEKEIFFNPFLPPKFFQ